MDGVGWPSGEWVNGGLGSCGTGGPRHTYPGREAAGGPATAGGDTCSGDTAACRHAGAGCNCGAAGH